MIGSLLCLNMPLRTGASWNHLSMVPSTMLLSVFFFGIEELAAQLEEPFSILPLGKLCDAVWDSAVELYSIPTQLPQGRGANDGMAPHPHSTVR